MKLVVRIRVVMVLQEVEEPKAHTGNTVMDVTPKASSIGYGLRNQYSVVPSCVQTCTLQQGSSLFHSEWTRDDTSGLFTVMCGEVA